MTVNNVPLPLDPRVIRPPEPEPTLSTPPVTGVLPFCGKITPFLLLREMIPLELEGNIGFAFEAIPPVLKFNLPPLKGNPVPATTLLLLPGSIFISAP